MSPFYPTRPIRALFVEVGFGAAAGIVALQLDRQLGAP